MFIYADYEPLYVTTLLGEASTESVSHDIGWKSLMTIK